MRNPTPRRDGAGPVADRRCGADCRRPGSRCLVPSRLCRHLTLQLSIALPPGEQVTTLPAISAAGGTVAYATGRTAATSQLYLRSLDDFAARIVPGSAGAQHPLFLPDVRAVAFFAGGKLRRAAVAGGALVDLASASTHMGLNVGLGKSHRRRDQPRSGLWRMPADGGPPDQLTTVVGGKRGYAHVLPQRRPGTGDLLFTLWAQTFYTERLSTATARGVRSGGRDPVPGLRSM
ncbi:hypothetical protein BH24ACT15_BH24ACT15_28540 [soil metagenome]